MAKDTPSIAKNKIRRSLIAICDPYPSKAEENVLWVYFESSCAYCNVPIDRKARTGHLDHLLSSAEGGTNNIHNFVLACARCNGDEKRDESWISFLKRKSESELANTQRKEKIENWLSLSSIKVLDKELSILKEAIIKEAVENFDLSVNKMRALRKTKR